MEEKHPLLVFVNPDELPVETVDTNERTTHESKTTENSQLLVTRTYHKDLASVIGKSSPSVMSSVLQSAREEEELQQAQSLVSPKNKLFLVGAILCIVLGGSALAYVFYTHQATTRMLGSAERTSLIAAETHTPVTLVEEEVFKNRSRIQQTLAQPVPPTTVHHIFFTKETPFGLQRLSVQETMRFTGGELPAALSETLLPSFMYGVYQTSQSYPFLILQVNDYDDAFDGMRAWEPFMTRHLGFLFDLPEHLVQRFDQLVFRSDVKANRPVRIVTFSEQASLEENTPLTEFLLEPEPVTTTEDTQEQELLEVEQQETQDEEEQLPQTPDDQLFSFVEQAETTSEQTSTGKQFKEGDIVLLYTFLNERTILVASDPQVLTELLLRITNAQLLL